MGVKTAYLHTEIGHNAGSILYRLAGCELLNTLLRQNFFHLNEVVTNGDEGLQNLGTSHL